MAEKTTKNPVPLCTGILSFFAFFMIFSRGQIYERAVQRFKLKFQHIYCARHFPTHTVIIISSFLNKNNNTFEIPIFIPACHAFNIRHFRINGWWSVGHILSKSDIPESLDYFEECSSDFCPQVNGMQTSWQLTGGHFRSLYIALSLPPFSTIGYRIKRTVPRDFRLLVFFMNQFPLSPWVHHQGHFKFFWKFSEISAAQGMLHRCCWYWWQMEKIFIQKIFNNFVWNTFGYSRVNK